MGNYKFKEVPFSPLFASLKEEGVAAMLLSTLTRRYVKLFAVHAQLIDDFDDGFLP
jgi:hypothetical protein